MERSLSWLAGQRPAMETLLAEIVTLPSHTADKAGVDAVGRALERAFPLPVTRNASKVFGDHLLFSGRRPARDGGLILVGHHDTVFPAATFSGYRVADGLARGPGVVDMKGGLVLMAFALRALEDEGLLHELPLTVAVVADEEVGSPESAPMVRAAAAGARAALVFESGRSGDAIITMRKGTGSVHVVARGRAAHAGASHRQGRNAVWAMARFVDAAQKLTDYDRGITVNVGKVWGGIGKNTVPDLAEAELDFRFVSRPDGAWVMARLEEAALAAAGGISGTAIDLTGGPARTPLERTAASAALSARYAESQRAVGLDAREAPLVGGGSDASTCADAGVPAIDGLGPRGDGFHTLDEHLDLESLVPKTQALAHFLVRFARS
ncbi:MAG: M20/M25/M40 family metallo-hydrolase [Deltaproteobacteria bacterium]|nr:M20/M25/M40 family metallo-hydrolase [Deltaproteobacteria bacterium]